MKKRNGPAFVALLVWCVLLPFTSGCDAILCGNGQLDEDEQCDDGNEEDWDGCGQCVFDAIQVAQSAQVQAPPSADMDRRGRIVVAWQSHLDSAPDAVGVQLFDEEGRAAGEPQYFNQGAGSFNEK